MFDFSIVTRWFDELLRQTLGLGNFSAILIECVLVGVAIIVGYAVLAIILIFMERKVCAYFQCRVVVRAAIVSSCGQIGEMN